MGLLGYAPIMPVKEGNCDLFVNRGGRTSSTCTIIEKLILSWKKCTKYSIIKDTQKRGGMKDV